MSNIELTIEHNCAFVKLLGVESQSFDNDMQFGNLVQILKNVLGIKKLVLDIRELDRMYWDIWRAIYSPNDFTSWNILVSSNDCYKHIRPYVDKYYITKVAIDSNRIPAHGKLLNLDQIDLLEQDIEYIGDVEFAKYIYKDTNCEHTDKISNIIDFYENYSQQSIMG